MKQPKQRSGKYTSLYTLTRLRHSEHLKLKSENGKRLYYNVSDLDRSIAFYRDILGLEFQSEILMEGEETDKCSVRKIVKQGLHF